MSEEVRWPQLGSPTTSATGPPSCWTLPNALGWWPRVAPHGRVFEVRACASSSVESICRHGHCRHPRRRRDCPETRIQRGEAGKERAAIRMAGPVRHTAPCNEGSGPLVLVAIGFVFEGRGYEILLDALAQVSVTSNVRLRVVGPGRPDYLEALRNRAEDCRSKMWIVVGTVESADVSRHYLDGHVGLVLYEPGDPGNDGLSNKILECVASGRPVIAGRPPREPPIRDGEFRWLADRCHPRSPRAHDSRGGRPPRPCRGFAALPFPRRRMA